MLKKNRRLSRSDFTTVFEKGKVIHASHLYIRKKPVSSWEEVSFGVVVSKKVAKKATERNNIRRRVYYALEKILQSAKKPIQGIVFVKKSPSNLSYTDLYEQIERLILS